MVVIRNKLNQRLIINLIGEKNIDLLAKGTANISEKDISSPHLQTLINRGDIVVMSKAKEKETETGVERDTKIYEKAPEQLKESETEAIREIGIGKKQLKRRFKK